MRFPMYMDVAHTTLDRSEVIRNPNQLDDNNSMEVDEAEVNDVYLDRCNRFSEVTQTNNAIAMMYLQDRNWDLQLSLTDYFKEHECPVTQTIDLTGDASFVEKPSTESCDNQPKLLTLLSWNLDGLDERNLRDRSITIISLIKNEEPDIVCFQEMTRSILDIYRTVLTNYHFFTALDDPLSDCIHYFVVILVRRVAQIRVDPSSLVVHSFPESKMGRQLLSVDVLLRPADWCVRGTGNQHQSVVNRELRLRIHNSHLESCREGSKERKTQLKYVWNQMLRIGSPPTNAVSASKLPQASVFSGDLNLRDSEVEELGGIPTGIIDAWEATGCRAELRSTWDPIRNINAGRLFKGKHRPQGNRYDRIYWSGRCLEAVDFGLRGLEKVPMSTCFPSDHWAVFSRFILR